MGYIDPNLFGILSQIGLAILLVVGVVFTFFRSSVKRFFGSFKKDRAKGETIEDSQKSEQ
jgi:hypothetical protein